MEMSLTIPPDLPDDELGLILLGRQYAPYKLTAAKRDILEAAKCEKVCEICSGLLGCQMRAKGWQMAFDESASDMYDYPMFLYRQCEKYKAKEVRKQEELVLSAKFQQRSFETFKITDKNREAFEICKEYADKFEKFTPYGLLLMGTVGTGKTHLAAAIVRVAIRKGIPTAFVKVPQLLEEIKAGYGGNGQESKQLQDKVKTRRLVVLDDLGAEKITDWTLDRMYQIIDSRYSQELPTIITTNCKHQELEDHVGKRAYDRILEMCQPAGITGPSYRRRKQTFLGTEVKTEVPAAWWNNV